MTADSLSAQVESAFQALARMISVARIRAEEKAKSTHERFNVFTALLKADDEVRLHTRFLHCLLDPNGIHDCGPLFLKLFFSTLDNIPCLDHDDKPFSFQPPPADKSWDVKKEASCPQGQIDLLLVRRNYGIAIENKINAHEQDKQLARYADYLAEEYGKSWVVIYLTRYGKCASTHDGQPYIRISYAEHILAWLDKCLRETYNIIPINQAILQYRGVVREVTGRNINSEDMKPIVEFVRQNPDIIRFRMQINEAIDNARISFFKNIIEKLGETYEVTRRDSSNVWFITPPPNSPLCGAPFKIGIDENENMLDIGIFAEANETKLTWEQQSILQTMNSLLNDYSETHDYHKAKSNIYWPVGWHTLISLDDETLATILGSPSEKAVDNCIRDILKYMEMLEVFYNEASALPHVPNGE